MHRMCYDYERTESPGVIVTIKQNALESNQMEVNASPYEQLGEDFR